jgi:hypothetical protein
MCGTRLLLLVPGEGCAQHVGGGGVRVSCRAVAVTIQRCAVIAGCDHTRVAPPAAAAARWRTPACCLLAAAHASACWWVRRPLLCCMCCWAVQLWERAAAPGEPASCVCVRVGDARRRVCCVAVWGKGAAGRGHGVLRSMERPSTNLPLEWMRRSEHNSHTVTVTQSWPVSPFQAHPHVRLVHTPRRSLHPGTHSVCIRAPQRCADNAPAARRVTAHAVRMRNARQRGA